MIHSHGARNFYAAVAFEQLIFPSPRRNTMHIPSFRLTSLIGGLTLTAAAIAHGGGEHSAGWAMKMMDADKDGTVTAAEHEAGAKKMFETMDGNKDGTVTAAEMDAAHEQMMQKMSAHRDRGEHGAADDHHDGNVAHDMNEHADAAKNDSGEEHHGDKHKMSSRMSSAEKIKAIDTNNDGKISAAEHAAGSRAMFSRMDADQDGRLTASEIRAGHAKMMSAKAEAGEETEQ
jgi:Ca2+-binding EF-hand superfamily protein